MGLFDFLTPPKKNDLLFGDLTYRRRAWRGQIIVSEFCDQPIPLEIEATKDSDLAAFREVFEAFHNNLDAAKVQIENESFATYQRYVREDRKAGNFTDKDYSQYPSVACATQMWRILTPFRLTITDTADAYNFVIWLDVFWPNPHYFRVYFNDSNLYELEVDG